MITWQREIETTLASQEQSSLLFVDTPIWPNKYSLYKDMQIKVELPASTKKTKDGKNYSTCFITVCIYYMIVMQLHGLYQNEQRFYNERISFA
jgi:hypothetical protein